MCAKSVDKPKSWVFDSQSPRQFIARLFCSLIGLMKSSRFRSISSINGNKCGIVVFGAWGFEQLFILLSIGRSFASKLNAESVYFWRRVYQVELSRSI